MNNFEQHLSELTPEEIRDAIAGANHARRERTRQDAVDAFAAAFEPSNRLTQQIVDELDALANTEETK